MKCQPPRLPGHLSWAAGTVPLASTPGVRGASPPGRWPGAHALALASPFTHFPEPAWQEELEGKGSVGPSR